MQTIAAPKLSKEDENLRVEFVRLYLRSRDPIRACQELGYLTPYAETQAATFMGESLVQCLIAKSEQDQKFKENDKYRTNKYRSWMEAQATYTGPGAQHGSRVAATAHLMKMHGMQGSDKIDKKVTVNSGVMIVPEVEDMDNWSDMAVKSQAKLKEKMEDDNN